MFSPLLRLLAFLAIALCTLPLGTAPRVSAQQPLCFDQTGFCVPDPAVVEFYQAHGGPLVLGYPVSRPFRLRGQQVQLFQRVGLRVRADGQVGALDLLDDLGPLARLNGVRLPAVDPELASRAPLPGQPDFAEQAAAFLAVEVPDSFAALPVGFRQTYLAAGGGEDALAALEVFGWPTSRPVRDPANPNLVSQRFQRAVFQYDVASGQSHPLLLGDYVKSALTGDGLPADLEADLGPSPLLREYSSLAGDGLQRPWELPESNLADAFRPMRAAAPRPLFPPGFGPDSGWPAEDGLATPGAGPDGGGYLLTVGQPGTLDRAASASASNLRPIGDFVLVVDAQVEQSGPSGYALYLRQQSDEDRFALVVDAGRRLATFYRRSGGETRILWDWSPAPMLRAPDRDRLMVRAVGSRFTVSINGAPLFDLEADGPDRGDLWLAAVSWGEPSGTVFSNLSVVAPE